MSMSIKDPQKNRLPGWLVWLTFSISVFAASLAPAHAQVSPPSRPILLVHGWCGSVYDWANLYSALFNGLPQSLYPTPVSYAHQLVYYVQYNAHTGTIQFALENDPTKGQSGGLTALNESDIPSSARFFAIQLYDPILGTDDPADVARVSVLNKAYELAQAIKHITSITGIGKVNVVAHSMGGLDIRAYLENMASAGDCYDYVNNVPYYKSPCSPGQEGAAYANNVGAVITIDTPHAGSPLADSDLRSLLPDSYACQKNDSVNSIEISPSSDLLNSLNYNRQTLAGKSPNPLGVPIQAIANYFSDITYSWTQLNGLSDDIVQLSSQCLTNDQSSSQCTVIPASMSPSSFSDINLSHYLATPSLDQDVKNNPDCWVIPDTEPMLHSMSCLGHLVSVEYEIPALLINDTVPWISSWAVTPVTLPLGNSISIGYSAVDLSKSTLARAELWRAPDAGGVPGSWSEIGLARTLSGNGPAQVQFSDTPTAAGKYWYGTHLFDSAGNEATEPEQVEVTVNAAAQAPTVIVQASPTQAIQGANVTFTASVQSNVGEPTGTITFYDGSSALSGAIGLNNVDTAAYNANSLSVGSHAITARYSGDGSFVASTSQPVTVTIGGASPHISVSPSTGTLGVTPFTKTGTGFTPNGPITHTATWPDNTKNVLPDYANSTGGFSYAVTYSKEVGTYYQTDTDSTTGQTSNQISWIVSSEVSNDFSLSVAPSSQSLNQSGSVGFNVVTSTTSGASQSISLSASNVPTGLTASFSPSTVNSGGQANLTISANSSVATGSYTITITGTGASGTHTSPVVVTVTQAQSGPIATLSPGIVRFNDQPVGSMSSPQNVILKNTGSGQLILSGIALSAGSDYTLNLPAGTSFPYILNALVPFQIQTSFAPAATGTRPGQIIVYDNAPGSPHTVTLTGNGTAAPPTLGTIIVNAKLNGILLPSVSNFYDYVVTGPSSYSGAGPYTFSVTPGAYSLTLSGASGGMTLSSISPSSNQTASAGGTVTFTLNFTAPNDFYPPAFSTTGSAGSVQIVKAGSTASYYVNLENPPPGNASVPITLSATGVPAGATNLFSPQPGYTGYASILTVATGAASPGVYTVGLIGTNSSGLTRNGSTSSLVITGPPAQPVQLASQTSGWVPGNAASSVVSNSVSGDGRFVVFSSSATNLASGNANGNKEIYVRDLQSSTTTPVSVSSNGSLADGDCFHAKISANGQFVVFYSSADNLYPGSNSENGVYVRDLAHGTTEREDVAPDGTPGNGNSIEGAISADGRFVAFSSIATNLINGTSGQQVFLRDRETGRTTLVSVGQDGSPANSGGGNVAISADGRFVAFLSRATNLVSQNTNGLSQAFVRDIQTGVTYLVSMSSSGTPANASIDNQSAPLALSADGRYVAFCTLATNLVPQSTDGSSFHIFLYDRQLQQMTLVDVDSVGTPLGGGESFVTPSISEDGRFVAFSGYDQVLIRDLVASQTAVVSLSADGTPGNNTSADDATLGVGGPEVAFTSTATNLVSANTGGQDSVFVALNPFVGSSSLKSLALSASSTNGGSTVAGTVALNGPAPTGGASVTVWSNNAAAEPPAIVVVPEGASSAPFSITTSLVQSETVAAILASYNGGSNAAALDLEPAAQLTVSPSSFDFGYQAVAISSGAQPFTLTNSGTAPLTLNSIQMSTGQVFSITENTCQSSISPGNSCSISVAFKPTASGSSSDAIAISVGSPAVIQSVGVAGNGAVPAPVLSPTTVNFGNVSMPASAPETASLSNTGNADLSGITASISGTNTGDFALSNDGCSGTILPPNSTCSITVKFSPKAKGTRTAVLSIGDSASGSPQTSGLSGIGVQSTPTIVWTPSATSVTYGAALGSGVLDAAANFNGTSLTGTFAYSASANGGAPQPVAASSVLGAGSYVITATFTPSDGTDYTTDTLTMPFTVNKAPLSVIANNQSMVYGGTVPPLAGTLTGVVPGDGIRASFATTGTSSSAAGTYPITTTLSDPNSKLGNYSVTETPGTLTIGKSSLTVTWTAPSAITYGTALSATQLNASSTTAGTFTYTPALGTVLSAGQQTLSVTFTPSDGTDYSATSQTVQLTVNKAPLSVAASNASMSYGGTVPTLTGTLTGVVSGDGITASYTTTATSSSAVGSYPITATLNDPNAKLGNYAVTNTSGTVTVNKATPGITWGAPAAITYGTALSAGQLNSSSTAIGSFTYAPALGALLGAGNQTLSVTFTPTDGADYTTATRTVQLTVNMAPLSVTANSQTMTYGGAVPTLTGTLAGVVAGDGITAAYTTTAISSSSGGTYPITATLNDPNSKLNNYSVTNTPGTLTINKATPPITWAAPAAITYGTALGAAQLDATASINGTFSYSPAAGAVLSAGSDKLTTTFTPNDATDYATTTTSVTLTVNQAVPTVTWATPAAITYPTALSAAQLDATASVPGTFNYNQATGTVPSVGVDTLSVTFTPNDSTNYTTASGSVKLNVNNPVPVIDGLSPGFTSAGGTALTLTVSGLAFTPNSTISWGSTALATQYVNATQLTAQVPAINTASFGSATVTVQTPTPGGGTSNSLTFEIDSAGTTPPTFTTLTATVTPGTSASYPVTLPGSPTNVSASCLNPPPGVACSYSSTTNAVTITTTSATPAGTYQIVVVFTETLSGAASAFIALPILLLPLAAWRRRITARVWFIVCFGFALIVGATCVGCGGGSQGGSTPPAQTHQVTSSGALTLVVQ